MYEMRLAQMAKPHLTQYRRYETIHKLKIRFHNKGDSIARDSEKSKTYLAESKIEEDKNIDYNRYLTKEEAESFVSRVIKSKFWEKCGTGKVRVEWMKDMGYNTIMAGYGMKGLIKLAPSCTSKFLILHELSHAAGYNNHGRGFRAFQIKIVSRFLGREAAGKLKKAYKDSKLSITPIGKTLDYDQWIVRYNKVKNNLSGGKNT